jgi:hypothetical protein
MTKYKCRGCSLNQLLGYDIYKKQVPSYKEKYGSPVGIIFDEMSMISKREIDLAYEMYPYAQHIYVGDYANGMYYQSSISDEPLYHPTDYIIRTGDRRSINEATIQFKLTVREIMRVNPVLTSPLRKYLCSVLPRERDIATSYNLDYVLTGTHSRCDYYTTKLRGDKNHYMVRNHSLSDVYKKMAGQEAYLNGEIITTDIGHNRCIVRHGFTVHSFQGNTIEPPTRCYIDLNSLNSNADIYTAISRIRDISQLYIL